MPQYFFILGRNPELSLAELAAVLPSGWKPVSYSKAVLIVECAQLDAESLMRRLGGTIKMGQIISQNKSNLTTELCDLITKNSSAEKKLFLGLSAYSLEQGIRLPSVRELRQLGIEVKRILQEKDYRVRLVTSKEITLSSVIVKKERLLRQGVELVLLYRSAAPRVPPERDIKSRATLDGEIILGKTLAVQEFEDASARDFGRPERSMGVGMLPIQLTKVMLNLSRLPIYGGLSSGDPEERPPTILDPFCGLGTVLMEASQMGYKNLIGTDLEQTMIDATKKNLEWSGNVGVASESSRQSERSLSAATPKIQLVASPVEELSKHLPPHSVDAIVTEPYMGPVRGIMNQESGIIGELVKLYIDAFREFSKILKPGGRVVFILPAFKNGAQLTKTSDRVLPEIKKLGFSPTSLLPSSYPLASSFSILYSRPDQKVLREIFVFEFKK